MFGFVALMLDDCSLIANSMPHIDIWFTYSHVPSIVALISCLASMGVSLCFECVLMAFHDAYKLALFQVEWNWFPNIKNSKKVFFYSRTRFLGWRNRFPDVSLVFATVFWTRNRVVHFRNRFPSVFFFSTSILHNFSLVTPICMFFISSGSL